MAHVGKRWPQAIHYDCWLWQYPGAPNLARNYRMRFKIAPAVAGSCLDTTRNLVSDDVEYLYTDVMCRWRWSFTCGDLWEIYLELLYDQQVELFPWRWSIYVAGVLHQRSIPLGPALGNTYEFPYLASLAQWTMPIPPSHYIVFMNPPPHPEPWPP